MPRLSRRLLAGLETEGLSAAGKLLPVAPLSAGAAIKPKAEKFWSVNIYLPFTRCQILYEMFVKQSKIALILRGWWPSNARGCELSPQLSDRRAEFKSRSWARDSRGDLPDGEQEVPSGLDTWTDAENCAFQEGELFQWVLAQLTESGPWLGRSATRSEKAPQVWCLVWPVLHMN